MKQLPVNKLLFICITSSFIFCFVVWNYTINRKDNIHKNAFISQEFSVKVEHVGDPATDATKFVKRSDDFFSRIIYNRVGKCGSRSMQTVISILAKRNGFTFHLSPISNRTRPPILDLKAEMQLINTIEPPMLYSRHIHFMNFAKFGLQAPIFINMIRDPIERFSSQYHFKRNGDLGRPGLARSYKPWGKGERELDINDCVLDNYTECSAGKLWYIIPYFCGQDALCRRPSVDSLHRAKQHLLDNYLAVGFLEDFEDTLKVFEKLMPYHFKGASEVWEGLSENSYNSTSTYKKQELNPRAYAVLRQRMALDYDFYNFARLLFNNLKLQVGIK